MLNLNDIDTIESDDDVSTEEYFTALQRAINGGSAWSFQGSYGRAMMDAISSGRCLLGTARARDYWGNIIPSRTDVAEGTKGSREFVLDNYGADWLELVEAV